jgi:hypothetical protein
MTDRADHYLMLESDGYALSIGGIKNFIWNLYYIMSIRSKRCLPC